MLRFAALIFLMQVAAGAVLIGVIGVVLRAQVQEDVAATVNVMREDLLAIYAEGGLPALTAAVEMRTDRMATHGAVLLVTDGQGRKRAGNLVRWPAGVMANTGLVEVSLLQMDHSAPDPMQIRVTRLPGGERLLTGRVVQTQHRVLALFEGASIVGLILAFTFAALTAWIAARWITARLEGTVDTLRGVQAGDLSRRVPEERADDAFAALGRSVNSTLDRVEALVRELQVATDGLAHDLKSPLTRVRVALEQAASRVREPEAQDAVARAAAEGERLLSIVETALRISRAEAGVGRENFAPVDLVGEVETMVEIFGPLVEEEGRTIRAMPRPPLILSIHRELFGQALSNLIDNSLKYGAGAITLSVDQRPDGALVSIADEGPGIAADTHAQALKRFGRLDGSRGGSGAGLGLSLVSAVAQLHDGGVELDDARPGLIVRLFLKAHEPTPHAG